MLVLKKMSVKKVAVYLAIIIVMAGSTGMVLLKNRKFASQEPWLGGKTEKNNEFIPAEDDLSADLAAENPSPVAGPTAGQKPNQPAGLSQMKASGETDLSIFKSEKFKALKENTLIYFEPSDPGKRDPFKPN